MKINQNTEIDINFVVKDEYALFDINISNEFTQIKEVGICKYSKIIDFIKMPNKANLSKVRNCINNTNIILIKNEVLRDLQEGRKLFKSVITSFDDFYIIKNNSPFTIAFQERESVFSVEHLKRSDKPFMDRFNEETIKDYQMVQIDLKQGLLFNMKNECIYFQGKYLFNEYTYDTMPTVNRVHDLNKIKRIMKSLGFVKAKDETKNTLQDIEYFFAKATEKDFIETYKIGEKIKSTYLEILTIILITKLGLDEKLGFDITKFINEKQSQNKMVHLNKELLNIKLKESIELPAPKKLKI